MKSIFINLWTESDFSISDKFQSAGKELIQKFNIGQHELEIYFILSKDVNDNEIEGVTFLFPSNLKNYKKIIIKPELTLIAKKKIIEEFIKLLDQDYHTIFIYHSTTNDYTIQHMLIHELTAKFLNKIVIVDEEQIQRVVCLNENFAGTTLDRNTYDHIHELVTSSNFKSAKKLIKGKNVDSRINTLLDLGYRLKNLDVRVFQGQADPFDILSEVLKEIIDDIPADELDFVESMKSLRNREQRAFIAYIYNYAQYLYEENDLVDFIVLYYRLAEEALLYSIGWDTNWKNKNDYDQYQYRKNNKYSIPIPRSYRVSTHYHSFLSELSKYIRKTEKKGVVSIRRDKYFGLDKLSEKNRYFADLYLFFNSKIFEEFLKLRHEGVSGHGFEDFTKDEFETMLNGKSPLGYIDPMLEKLDLKPEYSIFRMVQKAVLALAAKEVEQGVVTSE